MERRAKAGKNFSILAVAEGALSVEESKMKRKEWTAKRAEEGYTTRHQPYCQTGPGHDRRRNAHLCAGAYARAAVRLRRMTAFWRPQFGTYAAGLVAE